MEELCENVEHLEKYDAVIASEVLEHVNNVDTFICNIGKFLKVTSYSSIHDSRISSSQKVNVSSLL